ncbi:MAG: hypothetical protein J6X02_03060 [Bacilli bacterium]|nr:hypothetical protein [Bacilli bacterium]
MNAHNKQFLKEKFNVDVDKYSKETLNEIFRIINKKILVRTKETLEYNEELKRRIEFYESLIKNE